MPVETAVVEVVEAVDSVQSVLDTLPVGSHIEWTKTDTGERWVVYRGAGVAQHGEASTIARAVRLIGAKYEMVRDLSADPAAPPRRILVDEGGTEILPE